MKKTVAVALALMFSNAMANVQPSTDSGVCARIADYAAEVAMERDKGISLQDQLMSNEEDGLSVLDRYVETIYSQPNKSVLELKLLARSQCEAWQTSLRTRSPL